MSVESKIKELYELHKSSGLYDDCFENTIFKLTNAYDYSFLELNRLARTGKPSNNLEDYEDFDKLREAYRACVKFIHEDCKHDVFKQKISLADIRDFQKEMKDTIQFNYIRNIVDRYNLKRFEAYINNDVLTFKHIEGDRSFIYDAYQRNIADSIPGSKIDKDTRNVFDFNLKILELAKAKPEFQSKKIFKPMKHKLISLINELVPYYLDGLDKEIGALKGKEYFLFDYLLIYCYLVAIGIYKTAYLMSLRFDNEQVYQPSLLYPKDRLVEDLIDTLNINEETVKQVLFDLTYDYEFHKDRLTIYQPLFEVGDYYLCSINLISQSYVIDKVMKYFDVKGTNKEDLTLYHRYRATVMNHRMADNLPYMYKNLEVYENCTLTIDNKSKSEIDLVVFDHSSKTAGLIELKNYAPVDNENDEVHRERRINEAIEKRLSKDKITVENIDLFLKQNNIPKEYSSYNFYSLMITNIPIGGVGVKESIKVVDEALFYNLLKIYDGSLLAVLDTIETGSFFKTLDSLVTYRNMKHEYKGLKVEIIYK